MAKDSRETNWRWVWLGAAVILVLVFFAVRSLTRDRLQVRTVQVTRGALESTISTNGRVEPIENVQIHSPIATTIKAVYVQQGDKAPSGKVLLKLDDLQTRARVASAESGVKSAEAALEIATHNGTLEQQQSSTAEINRARMERENAQRDVDTLQKLTATGAAAPSEVSAAKQRLESANLSLDSLQTTSKNRYSPAEVARARAALSDAEANLVAAQNVLSQTTVRAPIAGTIYSMDVKATDFVEEGKTLLRMADLEDERVRAYFDEPEIGQLAVGQPIIIRWDARPGKNWHGHIERVPVTVITYGTRNVGEVLVKVDDADGLLLPDTNVTVTVTTSSEANAITIPREALHVENGKPFVFRVTGSELRRTPVTYGNMNLNQVAILSGLNPGDWVATGTISGQPLQEGVPIKELK
jgi:HlyD family secretion protein